MSSLGPQCHIHERDIEQLKDDLRSIRHAVWGNGREGLLDRMTKVEEVVKALKWVAATSAGALIAGVINIALAVMRHQ